MAQQFDPYSPVARNPTRGSAALLLQHQFLEGTRFHGLHRRVAAMQQRDSGFDPFRGQDVVLWAEAIIGHP
ncbi:MAG: hypothetical protein ACUVUC_09935 [Thermoguttaceae bacterium]